MLNDKNIRLTEYALPYYGSLGFKTVARATYLINYNIQHKTLKHIDKKQVHFNTKTQSNYSNAL